MLFDNLDTLTFFLFILIVGVEVLIVVIDLTYFKATFSFEP